MLTKINILCSCVLGITSLVIVTVYAIDDRPMDNIAIMWISWILVRVVASDIRRWDDLPEGEG